MLCCEHHLPIEVNGEFSHGLPKFCNIKQTDAFPMISTLQKSFAKVLRFNAYSRHASWLCTRFDR